MDWLDDNDATEPACCAPAPSLLSRRAFLAAGPLICAALPGGPASAQARAIVQGGAIDLHSHAGALIGMWRVDDGAPFAPLAGPMRDGGVAVVCLAIVPDAPALRSVADTRYQPFHTPEPGELYAYGQAAFGRLHALAADQGLRLIASAADLRAARADTPSAIVSSEGGDFLEGDPAKVDEAFHRWRLRHLQLTHYRVNELGDIQTDPPVHGGLTEAGAEVIRRCNRLGIVVDVAHGTYELVVQAAAVTTKPLVLSHTSLMLNPGPRMRRISPDHAKAVADTGGVIGIWPPVNIFASIPALAAGMARMAEQVGVDHVGLGTDMGGLIGGSCLDRYESVPHLADALLRIGFGPDDVGKLLGGNYARVASASLPGA
ncbi:MAG TPA: membrane dipeptidase [Acidisphaera sp.]|nr:membrane dipeptidase [Acidisphaera sp.]